MNEQRTVAGHNNVYVFGTEAKALEIMPGLHEQERRGARPEPKPAAQPQRKAKVDVFSVFLILTTFAAVMVVGIIYLNLNFQSTYLSKNVVNLQREVVELQKTNDALSEELEDGVNLNEIYKKATKLGMKPMKKSNIVTYQSKKNAEIRCYGEIPQN